MIGCDFLGLENLIHNERIQTSDIGYLYAIISILINNQKVITFDGRTDISNLKIIFKVSFFLIPKLSKVYQMRLASFGP